MKEIIEKLLKNKKLLITILIVFAFIVSVSFAMYNIVLQGQRTHSITTSKLSFSYKEPLEALDLLAYEALTDEEGKAQDNYYEFTVKAESAAAEVIDYVIYLQQEESEKSFSSSDIKVYLTTVSNNVETEILEPTLISDLLPFNETENTSALYGSNFTFTDTDLTDKSTTYRLRIWLREGFSFSNYIISSTTNGEQNIKLDSYEYKFKVNVATGEMSNKVQLDSSNANEPVLASNMIPVIYDSGNSTWVKADSSNKDLTWFNYTDKKWANAVTVTEANRDTYLKATAGTPIAMSDINTMWVWIPRFSATGDIANYNGGTASAPGAFNITFVDTETTAHDAFDFGGAVSGFWMGKFETTGSVSNACTSSSCNVSNVTILPNKLSLVSQTVSSFFYMSRSMETSGNAYGFDKTKDTTLDIHMLKNNEWGAVAYLTQSIYGRCTSSTSCTEIGINNNLSFVTGYGAPAGSEDIVSNGTYETELGMDASTTGNIYGVYDMSGGVYEYVMGLYWDGTKLWSGYNLYNNSGFNGWLEEDAKEYTNGVSYPSDSKYYNTYTNTGTEEAPVTNYTSMQHALTETSGWYGDGAQFVSASYPWVNRGGNYNCEDSAGIFTFYNNWGVSDFEQGVRSSLKVD